MAGKVELTVAQAKKIEGLLDLIPSKHFLDGGDSYHSHACHCSDCQQCYEMSTILSDKIKKAEKK